MNLLPEGVTATAEELVNSVKGHLEVISEMWIGDPNPKRANMYNEMRNEVIEEYRKTFEFKGNPHQ